MPNLAQRIRRLLWAFDIHPMRRSSFIGLVQKLSDAESTIGQLAGEISAFKLELAEYGTRFDRTIDELRALETALAHHEAQLGGVAEQTSALRRIVEDNDQDGAPIQAVGERLDDYMQKIERSRLDHSALAKRFAEVQGQIEKLAAQVPGPSARQFNYETTLILFGNALARLFKAFLSKDVVHFAVVGQHPTFISNIYHFLDFGLVPCGSFAGQGNFMIDAQPISAIPESGADLVLLCETDPEEEKKLIVELQGMRDAAGEPLRVVRLTRLVDEHIAVMDRLIAGHYSTCLTPTKLAALACALDLATGEGLIVEAGVFLGGGTIYMGLLQERLRGPRSMYAFDTFEGIPAPTERDGDSPFVEGLFSEASLDIVRANYRAHGLEDRIEPIAGLVQDTVPANLSDDDRIGLALLDLDQYAGTRAGLDAVVPRLHAAGIIVVDDADGPGVSGAIDETLAQHPELVRCNVSRGFDFVLRKQAPGLLSELQEASDRT